MKLQSMSISNYRCLKDIFVPFDSLTVLVGRNGVGKSCILSALRLFYNTNIQVSEHDFYNDDTSEDVSITLHFSDLTTSEKVTFKPYLEGNQLTVQKVISYSPPRFMQKYYGTRYRNKEFEAFRKAKGVELKKEYNKLKSKVQYKNFPSYTNKDEAEKVLEKWEIENKSHCNLVRDAGQFFGFQNVGTHRLEKNTRFIHIPAVQEASEQAIEQKGSVFEEIMELVVKSTLASSRVLEKLQEETEQRYKKVINPKRNKELKTLSGKLTTALKNYVPDSEVRINWLEASGVQIRVPQAYVTLREGECLSTVDRCGHGLQRAYILSLFQELATIQASTSMTEEESDENSDLPSLIIGIEEPELYQHPDRLRHFAQTLLKKFWFFNSNN